MLVGTFSSTLQLSKANRISSVETTMNVLGLTERYTAMLA